jgi:hypothetical protein
MKQYLHNYWNQAILAPVQRIKVSSHAWDCCFWLHFYCCCTAYLRFSKLLKLLGSWGPCSPAKGLPAGSKAPLAELPALLQVLAI